LTTACKNSAHSGNDAAPEGGTSDAPGDAQELGPTDAADLGATEGGPQDAAAAGDAVETGPAFALLATVSPPGPDNGIMATWGGVLQFTVAGDGAKLVVATGIDAAALADPVSLVFRKESSEVFVGNRHGNNAADGVAGSISRYVYDPTARTFTGSGSITGPTLSGVHWLTFSPTTGELFAANFAGGVARFTFDAQGVATANGSIGGGTCRGVLVSPDGKALYVTSATTAIRQFDLMTGTEGTAVTVPGNATLHALALRDKLVYAAGLNDNMVHRLTLGDDNNLTYKDAIESSQPASITFSPDGLEMFVGGHRASDVIDRFRFDAAAGVWKMTTTFSTGHSLGSVLVLE
jgi:DNA-binding beta-propeller fold protein YncE